MRSWRDTNGTATSFVPREGTAIRHAAADRGRERVIAAKLAKRVRGLRFVNRINTSAVPMTRIPRARQIRVIFGGGGLR